MEEIQKIVDELEDFLRFREWMMEDFVNWWNARISEFGLVSLAEIIRVLMGMRLIEDMDIKKSYYRYGFVRGIGETIDFEPKKSIGGKWTFKIKFPKLTRW